MNETELTLLYQAIDHDRDTVARVVEQLTDDELINLFNKLPVNHTAKLFAALLPRLQAILLPQLSDDTLHALCDIIDDHRLASLLRASDDATQQRITHRLTPKRSKHMANLLHYPDTTIGAWMSPSIAHLSANTRCRQAYPKILHLPSDQTWVMVVDNTQQLVGKIAVATLVKARQSDQPLQTLMQPVSLALPARLSLSQAASHPCWQVEDWVPVVDAHQWFIGTISEKQLKHAWHTLQQRSLAATSTAGSPSLSAWYGNHLLAFAQLLFIDDKP